MGGHGGLNILPQKTWNVYGRDNRLRVARDEQAAAEKDEIAAEEQRRREKDARYSALLEKQRDQRHVVIDCKQHSKSVLDDDKSVEHQNDYKTNHDDGDPMEKRLSAAARERAATRERGDPKTQTSDARFDAGFQFAKGMEGTPWWAPKNDCEDDQKRRDSKMEKTIGRKTSCLGYVKVTHGDKSSRRVPRDSRDTKKKQKKELYESLRRERLEREAAERKRMNTMLQSARRT